MKFKFNRLAILAPLMLGASAPMIGPAVRAMQDTPPAPTGLYVTRAPDNGDSAQYLVAWKAAPDSLQIEQTIVLYRVLGPRAHETTHVSTTTRDLFRLQLPKTGADTIWVAVRWMDRQGRSSDWTTADLPFVLASADTSAPTIPDPPPRGSESDPVAGAQLDSLHAEVGLIGGILSEAQAQWARVMATIQRLQTAAPSEPTPPPDTAVIPSGPVALNRVLIRPRLDTLYVGDQVQLCALQLWSDATATLADARQDTITACQAEVAKYNANPD